MPWAVDRTRTSGLAIIEVVEVPGLHKAVPLRWICPADLLETEDDDRSARPPHTSLRHRRRRKPKRAFDGRGDDLVIRRVRAMPSLPENLGDTFGLGENEASAHIREGEDAGSSR